MLSRVESYRCVCRAVSRLRSADNLLHCLKPSPVVFDEPAVMRGDGRIKQLGPDCLESLESAVLVCPHQARVARHIGGKDRGETARLAHASSPVASRRPDRKSSRYSVFRR
jgi:hypothetical protein